MHRPLVILAVFASIGTIAALEYARRQPSPVAATLPATSAPANPPVARVVDAARSLKLVTWTFDMTVDAQSISDRWYGDAVATVRAPVKYQYGVDLAGLKRDDLIIDELGQRYVFIVPAPKRISVEVDIEKLEQTLQTSGIRWRSANQNRLEEARTVLAHRAIDMTLSPEDQTRLRDASRQQLQSLLSTVLGQDLGMNRMIDVRFAE